MWTECKCEAGQGQEPDWACRLCVGGRCERRAAGEYGWISRGHGWMARLDKVKILTGLAGFGGGGVGEGLLVSVGGVPI